MPTDEKKEENKNGSSISNIYSTIHSLKNSLRKKNVLCRVNYLEPDAENKYGDFGALVITIYKDRGRPKEMSPKQISNLVNKQCKKNGITKYFSYGDITINGNTCEMQWDLKPKYVQAYTFNTKKIENNQEENKEDQTLKYNNFGINKPSYPSLNSIYGSV